MSNPVNGTFKTTDGCTISYTVHPGPDASAPRAVLIHSLALDRSIWDSVIPKLSAHATVLTYDCRGHGSSDHPAMRYTPELFARDLAQLLDHVQWPGAVVAGCSMGGCVAQAFAAAEPQRTTGLCLIDTTAWYGADAPKVWRERAAAAQAKGMASLIDFQLTRWFGDAFRAAHPETLKALTRVFLANDLKCYQATCEMLGDADLRPLLAAITAPTAVVVGEEDYAAPVAMAEAMQRGIPGSTLKVIAGGRHLTPVECPADIATAILDLTAMNQEQAR
jgi:3-oxoadipate enol-lactonase